MTLKALASLPSLQKRVLLVGPSWFYKSLAQKLKLKLKENFEKTPLFDTEGYVRDLESAFETMVQRNRAGLPAESFDVRATHR